MKTEIYFKAGLYAVPLYLTPFIEKLGDGLMNGNWPCWQQVIFCSLLGFSSTAIGLRAFFDGSYERNKKP